MSSGYFASAATTRGPLTALQNGTDGGNGVYRYTATASTFPDQTFGSENYWVDVVFEDGPDSTRPTVTARTPAPGAAGVGLGSDVTATFSEPVQQSTLGLELPRPRRHARHRHHVLRRGDPDCRPRPSGGPGRIDDVHRNRDRRP